MPSLPPAIVPLPSPFASLFDARTRCRVQILLTGAFRHTVSTALYCHVLSQAACSQAAWYVKTVPTFSDALACVRHPRWTGIPPFSCPGPPPTCGNAPSRRPRRSWPPSAARPDTRLLSHHPCRLCTKSSPGGEDGMLPVAGGSSVSGAPAARTPDQAGHISVRRGPGSGRLDPSAKAYGAAAETSLPARSCGSRTPARPCSRARTSINETGTVPYRPVSGGDFTRMWQGGLSAWAPLAAASARSRSRGRQLDSAWRTAAHKEPSPLSMSSRGLSKSVSGRVFPAQ